MWTAQIIKFLFIAVIAFNLRHEMHAVHKV